MKMNDQERTATEKPLSSYSGNGIGVGAALGAAFGALFGATSGNMGQVLAICVALGTAVGGVFDFAQRGKSKPKNEGT